VRPAAVLAIVVVMLVVAPAASASGRLTAADRHAIGVLVDRFVKDAVRRQNLAAAWNLAGPDLRGGTTRGAWIRGTGVTVPFFPASGTDFTNAWTGHLVAPGHAELSLVMHPRAGTRGYDETAASIDVHKTGGRWLVDLFYAAAVIRTSAGHRGSCGLATCSVSGPADFGPAAAAGASAGGVAHGSGHWLLIGLAAIGGIVLLVPLGIWLRARRRDRRAWAAYRSAHG
jgi:hypothetical protein